MLRSKTRLRSLLVIAFLLSVSSLLTQVEANPGAHVSVPHSPLTVGQSVYIEYYTDPGEDGTASVYVKRGGGGADIWDSGPQSITGGLLYDVTAPGLTTPGTYIAGVTVWLGAIPGPTINAEFAFQVVSGSAFDFNFELSPPNVVVKQGETAIFRILLTYSDPSYSGTTISIQLSGLGPGMNYQLIENPPTLNILTSKSTPPGNYPITVIGSANGVTHQAGAYVTVQTAEAFDFSLSASPQQQNITPGGSATYTLTVGLISGTTQSVALTVSGAPSGVTASLSPTSGTPPFGSTLSVTATSSASPGAVTLTVSGNGGGVSRSAPITLVVSQAPDFRINVTPPSQTVLQGQTTSYAVNVAGLNGFNSQVSLAVAGLPSGIGGIFSVPSSIPDYSSTLTMTIPSGSPTGSFTLTITGSGGGVTRVANVVLLVNPSQTQTETTQTATTQTRTNMPGGLLDILQQNSLLIIAALAALVILFAVLAMRGRSRPAAPQQMGPSRIFCGKCGAENPASNEFCQGCGQKLSSS